jgi:hypothetical protein
MPERVRVNKTFCPPLLPPVFAQVSDRLSAVSRLILLKTHTVTTLRRSRIGFTHLALMNKLVATIIDGDPTFNPVREYYRMFPQEPSILLPLTGVGLPIDGPIISIADMTFEKVIERMTEEARRGGFMTFLLIEHGHFLGSFDRPVGLTLPVASDTTALATEEVFVELRRLKELQPDFSKDVDPKQVKDLQTNEGVLKQSVLLRLDHKIRQLRNSGIAELEIRACNLGANRNALAALGDALDLLAISAPTVGMFYSRVNPSPDNRFRRSVQSLRQWARVPPGTGASLFLESTGGSSTQSRRRRPGSLRGNQGNNVAGGDSGSGVALRVDILGSDHDRTSTVSAATPDWGAVARFVGRNIMSPSRYSGRGPFFIAGMERSDSQGHPFTLPLDPVYKSSLVAYLPPFKKFRG